MNKLSWVAAGIACVLVAGAWTRALDRVAQDRREAVEEALRVGSALAHAYEQGIAARLDALQAEGRRPELAAAITSAKVGAPRPAPGAMHVVHVLSAEDRRNLRHDGHLYSFRTLALHPVTVAVGMAESTVLAAAHRRRSDHYIVALLESLLAVIAAAAMARHAWRAVSQERRLDRDQWSQGSRNPADAAPHGG